MWYVIYADQGGSAHSRAERSRDSAIQIACEFLRRSYEVRRVIGPDGLNIERPELDAHCNDWRLAGRVY
jgi:hypothetical protein